MPATPFSPASALSAAMDLLLEDAAPSWVRLSLHLGALLELVDHPDLSALDSDSAQQLTRSLALRPARLDDWFSLVWPEPVIADTVEHLERCRRSPARLADAVRLASGAALEQLRASFGLRSVTISDCGRFGLSFSELGSVMLVEDLARAVPVLALPCRSADHGRLVPADGAVLAAVGWDDTLSVLDAGNGALLAEVALHGHLARLAPGPSGCLLAHFGPEDAATQLVHCAGPGASAAQRF